MAVIRATIHFERKFWVGIFERTDREGYAVARNIFGGEPSDAEVYQFVLENYCDLKFGPPQEFKLEIQRMNPKRVQRIVRREMEKAKDSLQPSTHAQDYMREEMEKNKKEKKHLTAKQKEERKEMQFLLRQEKKKEKHRGH
jgi:hypothetical protein